MLRVGLNRLANAQAIRGMSTASGPSGSVSKVASMAEKIRQFISSESTKKAIQASLIELRPPTPVEIPRAIRDGIRLFTQANWRNVTVREAWLNTLVTTEVICWFFVGEAIGKGTIVGYQV